MAIREVREIETVQTYKTMQKSYKNGLRTKMLIPIDTWRPCMKKWCRSAAPQVGVLQNRLLSIFYASHYSYYLEITQTSAEYIRGRKRWGQVGNQLLFRIMYL